MTERAVIAKRVIEYLRKNAPDIAAIVAKDMSAGDVHVTTALGNQPGSKKISFAEALIAARKPKKIPDKEPATVLVKTDLPLQIAKMDAEQQKVFGWAYISQRGEQLIIDKQGDIILPEDLEKAAHDFVLFSRSQGDMHTVGVSGDPEQHGRLIGSVVYTKEKFDKCGLAAFDPENGDQLFGWWVEFKVDSPELWEAHKRGERPEFSIGGKGRRVELPHDIGKSDTSRRILIVRHGATKLNNDDVSVDRIRGWSNVPLSPEGREEAIRLGYLLADDPPDHIVASDLARAAETARIISNIMDVPIQMVTQGLRPWNVGVFSGQITAIAIPILADYVRYKPDEPVPEGESFNTFRQRFMLTVNQLLDKYDGKIAMVTHHRGERLLLSWAAAGYPSDGTIDVDTFCQPGEAPGQVTDLEIDIEPLMEAAAE
jgi:broad specificity phosphatase PhoE